MIVKADSKYKEQIAKLWCEAFGDEAADAGEYIDFLLKYFYLYLDGEKVCSMAAVLPVTFEEKNGGYIYAVATDMEFRGNGYATRILNFIKSEKEYEFFVLTPAESELFGFYEKLGFVPFSPILKKTLKVNDVPENIFCEKISAEEYARYRRLYFSGQLIEWSPKMLYFAKDMYGGEFFCLKEEDRQIGICFCYVVGDKACVKEMIAEKPELAAMKIASIMGTNTVEVSRYAPAAPLKSMIFPEKFAQCFFAISLD